MNTFQHPIYYIHLIAKALAGDAIPPITLIGIETSGRQELWGTLEEVLEVANHVEGTVPVLNMAHIHARGHGRLRTSEDMTAERLSDWERR